MWHRSCGFARVAASVYIVSYQHRDSRARHTLDMYCLCTDAQMRAAHTGANFDLRLGPRFLRISRARQRRWSSRVVRVPARSHVRSVLLRYCRDPTEGRPKMHDDGAMIVNSRLVLADSSFGENGLSQRYALDFRLLVSFLVSKSQEGIPTSLTAGQCASTRMSLLGRPRWRTSLDPVRQTRLIEACTAGEV